MGALCSRDQGVEEMNRKGVFFSLVAVFIVMLFSLNVDITKETGALDRSFSVTRTKIELLNEAIIDLDEVCFEKMLTVASKNTLEALTEYTIDTDSPIVNGFNQDDDYKFFKEFSSVMYNATLYSGTPFEVDLKTLNPSGGGKYYDGVPMQDTITEVIAMYDTIGFEVLQFDVEVMDIEQIDPWNIQVSARFFYDFQDKDEVARWKGESIEQAIVSVYGLWYKPWDGAIPSLPSKLRINSTSFIEDNHSTLDSSDPNYNINCEFTSSPFNECVGDPSCDCTYSPAILSRLRGREYKQTSSWDYKKSICMKAEGCNDVSP